MASLRVLAFDHEGRPIQFDTWLDDLQLYLLSDSKDSVSLFDHTSGAAPAPPAMANSATRSQLLTRDAAARLAIRNHLPLAECAHFGQHRTAQALYDAVVARYSSLATVALARLLLPYLFPELDHCLALDPTALTVDLLKQHLLAAETSVVAVGAVRGTPRTPFFEGCSPSLLAPSYAATAAADVPGAEDVGAAFASAKRRRWKGKGGRGGGGGNGGGGGGSSGGGGGGGGGGGSGSGGGSGGFGGGGGGSDEGGGSGGSGSGGGRAGATQRGRSGSGQRQHARGDCYFCVPPGPGIQAAALGANESVLPGTASAGVTMLVRHAGSLTFSTAASPASTTLGAQSLAAALGASESVLAGTASAEALHTFTLDSAASRCFFRDSTTLTPLSAPVPVRLADPSGGPVLARSSTLLPCPAVPSGSLSALHLPSFSTNVRLYTLATEPPQVAASAQVSASSEVAPPCSCRLLSHQTLLWHHRLGHPSRPRLRGMHSRLLVSSLPRSLPPLPPSPAPPCLPCVERQQRAAPHSSSFPPMIAPLQTLHMDVWGPARVSGQGRECYFLLFVDDYMRYTTVFPLHSKGQVVYVLIPWIRAVHLQLRERFRQDLPVQRLHSDRGGEFSSDLLRDFYRGEGILQSFMLPDSPQKNGIAERRIGLVMEVARTSMIHAAAPHFLRPFAVRYAAHQLNLWPCVSLPETSPTLRWTGKVGDAVGFRVWGSRAFVYDTSADKLSTRAILCIFLGFSLDAPGWQVYQPPPPLFFPSQDITFDESVPFYRLFPYRSAPPLPPLLFLAPGPPPVVPLPPQGPSPSGVSQVDPLPGTAPVEVVVGSGAARGAACGVATSRGAEPGGAESEGAGSGGAKPRGAEPAGAEPAGVELGGAESEGAESGGAKPRGTASSGGPAGASPRLSPRPEPLSPQQLRKWFAQRTRLWSGAAGAGDSAVGDSGAGGAGITAGAGGTGGAAAAGPGGARTRVTGAAGTGGVGGARAGDPTEPGVAGAGGAGAVGAGARGTGARGAGAVDPGAGGAGGTVRPRPYFVLLLQQVLGVPSSTGLTPPLLCPPPDQSQPPLQPASPLRAPSPYTEETCGLTERREPASRPASLVRTARRVSCSRPPPVPGTHAMTLRPSSVPLRVPVPPQPESSLPAVLDPESALVLTSTAVSALVAELVDFAAACRLDYATALVAESESASPPSVGGECALGTDVLEDRQEDFECLAAAVPRFASMLLVPEGDPDAPDIPTPLSYAEAITGHYSS
ncbi:unnamed protein product [Closterium sp. NIES-54]